MQFHDWITCYQLSKRFVLEAGDLTYEEFYRTLGPTRGSHPQWGGLDSKIVEARVQSENDWKLARNPFYNVWPVALEPMAKVPLTLNGEHIRPFIHPVVMRFPIGMEPHTSAGTSLYSVMTFGTIDRNGNRGLAVLSQTDPVADNIHYLVFLLDEKDDVETNILNTPAKDADQDTWDVNKLSTRFALALCLMRDDPDLITADVLSADRQKYEETGDQKYVDRAHRRGKIGWHIGSRLEVDPHYRRAHFGLRWTGEGRKIPRIVSVKGCIVKRHKLSQVPTGYADDVTNH